MYSAPLPLGEEGVEMKGLLGLGALGGEAWAAAARSSLTVALTVSQHTGRSFEPFFIVIQLWAPQLASALLHKYNEFHGVVVTLFGFVTCQNLCGGWMRGPVFSVCAPL